MKSSLLSIFTAKKFLLVLVVILLFLSSGCNTVVNKPVSNDKITVYTSIYPVYDFTKRIGGDKISVVNIVPAGAQPHSFEPSTQLVAQLSKASLFIYNGAGMEHYLPKLAQTLADTSVRLVDTSSDIELLSAEHHHEESEEHHDHDHGEYDPHIWLSPARALKQSQTICQALAEADPLNAEYYQANLEKFRQELETLHKEYLTLADCPHKDVIVSHAAFTYLTYDYGLRQLSLMGINADAEPGPLTLKNTIKYIKENKIRYIFWDTLDNPKLAQTLSQESGAEVLPLNSLGALGAKDLQAGEDYLSVMRANLTNLKKGLGY